MGVNFNFWRGARETHCRGDQWSPADLFVENFRATNGRPYKFDKLSNNFAQDFLFDHTVKYQFITHIIYLNKNTGLS